MKIAEALMLRGDMQKKLASLRERIGQNAVVQEGDKPHENASTLIKEAFSVIEELETLVVKINQANSRTKLPNGSTLAESIASRDRLAQQHSLIQHALATSHKEPDRYSISEIKWVATLKVSDLQKKAEDLAKQIREMNAVIQETNWNSALQQEGKL